MAAETRRAIAKADNYTLMFELIANRIKRELPEEEFDILMRVPVIHKAVGLALQSGGEVDDVELEPPPEEPEESEESDNPDDE